MPTVHLRVVGTVQGVYYRATCKEIAEGMNISGHAKNESDGSVSITATGKKPQLDCLIDWCSKGPSAASVSSVTQEWSTDEPEYHGFGIL